MIKSRTRIVLRLNYLSLDFVFNNILDQPMKLNIFIILAIVTTFANSQNTTKPLVLEQTLQIRLPAEQMYSFSIAIPANNTADKDLFLLVQWPLNDPLQNPFLDIFVDDYQMSCYNSNDQFSGVCRIPSKQFSANSTIQASIYCFVECKLKIYSTLSSRLRVSINDSLIFTAPPSNNLPLQIQIQVPQNLNFTQIAVYAQIQSIQKASEGLEMLANVGNQSQPIPTKTNYYANGQSMFWGGKGIFLSKQQIKAGQWIKLYLYLSQGMQVKLSFTVMSGNNFMIELDKAYFDFTSYQEPKTYALDLTKKTAQLQNNTLEILFIIYSGNPYIEIATDQQFLNQLNLRNLASTSTYLITPSIRKSNNFTGFIFIRVTSYWSSDYLFSTSADTRNYMSIQPDISIYNQLQGDQVYNYFFDDLVYILPNATTTRTYSLRIQIAKGSITYGIRRCKSAQVGKSILDCVINNQSQLSNTNVISSFQEIDLTVKESDIDYYLAFQINTNKCALLNNSSAYYCTFHIVIFQSGNSSTDFTLTLNKRIYTSTLREGQLSRHLIFKEEYLYFRYSISSLDDVLSITFYITIIEGDLYLLGSTADEFPTMDTDSKNVSLSMGNYLTFDKDQLAKTIYISAYANEFSQFTLGVKVTRKSSDNSTNTTSVNHTKLTLKLDVSQQFFFEEADTQVAFVLSTQQTMNITVQVMMLSGTVNLQIRDDKDKKVQCINSSTSNYKIVCSFTAFQKTTFNALVEGKKGEIQKFVILYHQSDQCITYSLNTPLYLTTQSNQTVCVKYSLTKVAELQVTTNAPLSYLLDQSLKMTVWLNGNSLLPTLSHHQQITKNEINSYCKFAKNATNTSNTVQSCEIKVTFASKSPLEFVVIVQQGGKDIGLLDGIVQKVSSYDLTHENGKYFYYPIYDWSAIQIFFTSFTSDSFYVALHFVQESAFLSNNSIIYLPYSQASYYSLKNQFQSNFYQNIVYGSYTNILSISSTIVKKYCSECVLTIAVYPRYNKDRSLFSFQIEITQTETTLFLGHSKIGFLQADEIYNYQLEQNKNSDSILSIKDINKQSNSQQSCFSASLTSKDSEVSINNGLAFVAKGSSLNNLYVQAKSTYCNYQVTYTSVDAPLIIVTKNRNYKFQSSKAAKMYLLHTHSNNQSFNIIQIINTGSLNVYVSPVTANSSISTLLKANLSTFSFVNSDFDGQFLIKNTSKYFCSNCQYLIALQAPAAINAQIMIAHYNSSIPLSVNGIIKQRVVKSQLNIRNYTFNTISAFNLTVSPIYGKVNVVVFDPSQNIIANSTISKTQIFVIPHNKKTENMSYDYNSYATRYSINVECTYDCSYTIKASKQNSTYRIFAGIPFYYFFDSNETIVLQFLNLNGANAQSNSLNFLVDIIQTYSNSTTPNITVLAQFQTVQGASPISIPITSFSKSQDSYNLELPLKVGTYYLSITASSSFYCTLMLVKQQLIHLRPSSSAVMFKQAIFELYSQQQSAVVQVFTCYGDLRIDASQKYNDLSSTVTGSTELILEQTNYGGHFVIHTQKTYGEYFIKIGNRKKQQSQVGYLITYHYYDSGDVSPYKLIELVNRQISYTLTSTSIVFSFEPIKINWDLTQSIDEVLEEYILYISDSKIKVSQYANCKLGNISKFYPQADDVTEDSVSVSIEISKINQIIGEKEIYFVGVEARAYLQSSQSADDDYPDQLKMIYEVIQLNNVKMPVSSQNSTSSYSAQIIILWFLLPFGIAGLILYFALKYCIKKYRGFIPNELIQQGHGESEQGVNLPDQSPCSADNNASQSLKDEV